MTYAASGLVTDRHDRFDQNAPADSAEWRQFLADVERRFVTIPERDLIGRQEWVTWHYIGQGLAQHRAAQLCRNELWQISAFGWQQKLPHIAALQPVGSDRLRQQALARWRSLPAWIDQEILNLKEGLRLRYKATQSTVRATLAQLDALLVGDPAHSPFVEPAQRDGTSAFHSEWMKVIERDVWPALRRYRDFLRDEYLPRARTQVSLSANTDGLACYRATIFANTTVDEDPRKLFELAMARQTAERELALALAHKVFGETVRDWNALAVVMRTDPRARFSGEEEVETNARATFARAAAALPRMIVNPPPADVKIEPLAEFTQNSGPGGEYVPGADDGSRPPTFYFRNDPSRLSRAPFESLVFHETIPGHHLQAAVMAQDSRGALHPLTRLLWFSGPGEGWAVYAEGLARDLGLHTSDYEVIGSLLSSTTPPMVADLGMQVMGWSSERATEYLIEAQPLRDAERSRQLVGTISGLPGLGIAYPLGAMQFERMRSVAEERLGEDFDMREFHRVMLEDGRLPFSALNSKLMRWIDAKTDQGERR